MSRHQEMTILRPELFSRSHTPLTRDTALARRAEVAERGLVGGDGFEPPTLSV
jgi:hypothetical protein